MRMLNPIARRPTSVRGVASVAALVLAAALVLVAGLPTVPAAGTSAPGAESESPGVVVETEGEGTGLWIVQLAEPSLATYAGDVPGLAPTSPHATGASRLDVEASASVAYLDYLEDRHDRIAERMSQTLGRPVEVEFQYLNVVNGLAVRVDDEEAPRLAELPGVAAVYRDVVRDRETDVSHELVGSPGVWAGETGAGLASRGEGVVVGMLDTGVNPEHPSFAATDGEGYAHTNPLGSGTFLGVCDPDHPNHDDICNDKLIGAWTFHPFSPTARDLFGHGSHVGSTIAGNVHEATLDVAADEVTRTVQGVAPRANVISYQVCFPTCPETSTVAAVDQAIADPTQVLNYSIEGVDNPWNDVVSLAFLDAFNAGIFVATSAGNSGPQAGTAAKTAPWNASVAASTHHRVFGHRMDVTGPAPVPPALTNLAGVPGNGPPPEADIEAEIRDAGTVAPGNELGCVPFPAGSLDGSIALIDRGECAFAVKVVNASADGAIAVVIANDTGGPPGMMEQLGQTTIPAVMVDQPAGAALRDLIAANEPAPTTVRIAAAVDVFLDGDWADLLAPFSSRGPSQFELLTPTIAAPGVNVLAANAPAGADPVQYAVASGTSMASPHVAGAGALLMALHPGWSPAQVQSALVGTADADGILADDGTSPAGVFDVGSGRLDVANASRAGLVLDETYANFVAANPAAGGDPKELNIPALVDHRCAASCSWTRTLTNAAAVEATYTATAAASAGVTVTVSPAEFTLTPGAEQTVRITADLDPAVHPEGEWVSATVGFDTDAEHPSGQVVAPARYPIAVVAAEPDHISLVAEAYQSRARFYAELTWSGATSDQVDILRDGELLTTVDNNRRYIDELEEQARGTTITYQVCRVGSREVCSDEASVEINPRVPPRQTPAITTTELPDLNLLERYEHRLLATGGSGSYVWEATGLPSGLILDESTGVLRNDPADPAVTDVAGPVEVTVSVRDAARPGPTDSTTFELAVVGVDHVAAGWGHTCAVTTEETAYCWGRDATGQIGRGVVGGDGVHVPLPSQVLNTEGDGPLTGVDQIAGGDGHTCALTTNGTVYCWGASFDGRLGDGDPTPEPKPLPVQVRAPDDSGPLSDIVEIAVGWQFGCAITSGEDLYCWGNNASGKLGIGTVGGIQPLPVAVRNSDDSGPLTGVTAVAAASSHGCALAGGVPYCWGGNFQGQLGNGETGVGGPLPVPVRDVDGSGSLPGVIQLAADSGHTCALAAGGTAYCWGSNGSGQLGRGEAGGNLPLAAAVQDSAGAGPLAEVTAIVAGGNHSCALADGGTAYCWGFNGSGQLGTGELGVPSTLPAAVRDDGGTDPLSGVTSLTAGSSHTCALTTTSATYCWGANFNWQLGIGETAEDLRAPLPVPVRPGPTR
jgi:alpha-tubulin suppressor-like RCC1 family protein/subtilisin family serine protease